jgi:hypothetical protein
MNHSHSYHHRHEMQSPQNWRGLFWVSGIGATLWLLLRSGFNPKRLAYPCQRAALAASLSFWTSIASMIGLTALLQRARSKALLAKVVLAALTVGVSLLVSASANIPAPHTASLVLPAWTNPSAVSNVYVAANVPAPLCSLEGGVIPSSGACSSPDFAFKDEGVDALLSQMDGSGQYFYKTAEHPDGLFGADHIVVIKINNQWAANGSGDGKGRLTTNTDVLKGVIWRVLQHPDGFSGEVVVAENTEGAKMPHFNITPANAQDQRQSFQDVVNAFRSQGYNVSLKDWTAFYDDPNPVHGGNLGDSDYPVGEFARGDNSDRYILLDDPSAGGADQISYPKFTTVGGSQVSMKYGIWNGSAYEDRLDFINMPVLKRHGMAGATIAWKNYVGFATKANGESRFGGWDEMHNFFWGYTGGPNKDYGLIAHEMHDVVLPKLNIVDAIWVAINSNTSGEAVRRNTILASTDPFAVDWYASEYILRPSVSGQPANVSAALNGTFRRATLTNQKAARALWGDAYPFINMDEACGAGSAACDSEKNQMNVLVNDLGYLAIPALNAPSGTIYTRTPAYQWNAVGAASKYTLLVSRASTGKTLISKTVKSSSCADGVCSTKSSTRLPAGNYYFRVRSHTAAGWSAYSEALPFIISTPPPPVLIAPSGAVAAGKPVFQWNTSTAASKYTLALLNAGSGKTIFTTTVSASKCSEGICNITSLKSLSAGNYYFKVKAYGSAGWSAYSTPQDFSITP